MGQRTLYAKRTQVGNLEFKSQVVSVLTVPTRTSGEVLFRAFVNVCSSSLLFEVPRKGCVS